jgi:hypothetical protein
MEAEVKLVPVTPRVSAALPDAALVWLNAVTVGPEVVIGNEREPEGALPGLDTVINATPVAAIRLAGTNALT